MRFSVNGEPVEYAGPGGRRLLDVLRRDLGLTGTKEGCGEGECGTCTVLVDGKPATSCLVPVAQVDGHAIETIEGLAESASGLDPMQRAFLDAGAAQCGFCTPGMVLAGKAAAESGTSGDRAIREAIAGNLCRCTGYSKIVEAIERATATDGTDTRDASDTRTDGRTGGRTDATTAGEPTGGTSIRLSATDGLGISTPSSLAQALTLVQSGGYRPVAGGTDVMVELSPGASNPLGIHTGRVPGRLLDISRLAELRGIRIQHGLDAAVLDIGALTTYADLRRSPLVAEHLPILADVAAVIGAAQIQERGTIGGNCVNASPAGDMLPLLLASDARLVVASHRGEREIPAAAFWPSYRHPAIAPDELLARILVPLPDRREMRFRKVGTRRAQAISKVAVALAWRSGRSDGEWHDVRVALASVAPVPIRARRTEAVLEGAAPSASLAEEAAATLAAEIAPIDDIRSTAEYRRTVAGNVLRRLILDAAK